MIRLSLVAMAFSAIKPQKSFDDYGFHRDSYGSADYLKGVLTACLPAIFLGSQIKEEDADAIATAVTFLFALPSQAIAATVFQTIAR